MKRRTNRGNELDSRFYAPRPFFVATHTDDKPTSLQFTDGTFDSLFTYSKYINKSFRGNIILLDYGFQNSMFLF